MANLTNIISEIQTLTSAEKLTLCKKLFDELSPDEKKEICPGNSRDSRGSGEKPKSFWHGFSRSEGKETYFKDRNQ